MTHVATKASPMPASEPCASRSARSSAVTNASSPPSWPPPPRLLLPPREKVSGERLTDEEDEGIARRPPPHPSPFGRHLLPRGEKGRGTTRALNPMAERVLWRRTWSIA